MKLKIVELKFNEPKIKVLNLKFSFNSNEFWRTGVDVYFLYKLHLTQFPRSLRPSFPTALLDFGFPFLQIEEEQEYFEKLKDRLDHFIETFIEVCGVELKLLKEFHDFLNPSIESLEFPKELDSGDCNILPVKEWFPATSRFIRSSISRIRHRSPSPHLGLDAMEIRENGFEDEKRLSIQRIRLADLEPTRTDLIQLKVESIDSDLGNLFRVTNEFEQRKSLLQESLKSVSYLLNTLSGCKNLLKEINSIYDHGGKELEIIDDIEKDSDIIEDFIKYPLQIQLEDVFSLTRGLNERIFSIKSLDEALIDRQRSFDQLTQLQTEATQAMDRSQGSLANLTLNSLAFDRKIAAKNAEIERKIRKVEECRNDFSGIDKQISFQLEKWEILSDSFLLNKLKRIP